MKEWKDMTGAEARFEFAEIRGDDIVERLRLMGTHYGGTGSEVADEAAVEIERLRAENERLAAIVERMLEDVRPKPPRPCDCDRCDCGNMGDYAKVVAWDSDQYRYERLVEIAAEQEVQP